VVDLEAAVVPMVEVVQEGWAILLAQLQAKGTVAEVA